MNCSETLKIIKTLEKDLKVPIYFYGDLITSLILNDQNDTNILEAYVKESNLNSLRKNIFNHPKKYKIIIDSLALTGKDYGLTITTGGLYVTLFPVKEESGGLVIPNYSYNEKTQDIKVTSLMFSNITYNDVLKKINITNSLIHIVSNEFVYLLKHNSKRQEEQKFLINLGKIIDKETYKKILEKTKNSKIVDKIEILSLNFTSDRQIYEYIINRFDYGAKHIIGNRKLLLPIDKEDNKYYDSKMAKKVGFPIQKIPRFDKIHLQSIKDMSITNPIGISIDRVEFAAFYLEKLGYQVKRYALIEYKKNKEINLDHTFLAYKKNNKWYSFESTLKDFEGIKEFNSLQTLEQLVGAKLFLWKAKFKIDSNKFNVDSEALVEYSKPKYNSSYNELLKQFKNSPLKNTDIAKKCFKQRQNVLLKKCKSKKDIDKLLKSLNEESPMSKKFIILISVILIISIGIGVMSAFILNN